RRSLLNNHPPFLLITTVKGRAIQEKARNPRGRAKSHGKLLTGSRNRQPIQGHSLARESERMVTCAQSE
ncbi:hypothetical protein LEMLEM_LOCUS25117, partial [Lemmus lemmus]